MEQFHTIKSQTINFKIWMAGDYHLAKEFLRTYCDRGFCVSIQKTDYIYTFGEECGFCVSIINYPRFQRSLSELEASAKDIANGLCFRLHQGSYTIEGPSETVFFSRRKVDKK